MNRNKIVMPWQFEGANCTGLDTELYFPQNAEGTLEHKMARKLCSDCKWVSECLTYALHYRVDGVWGGTTFVERDKLRKKLNIIPKPITNERYVS